MRCAEGIIKNHDSIHASKGGYILLQKHWGKNVLHHMGFVKCRVKTKAKVSIKNFNELKAHFFYMHVSELLLRWIPVD